MRPRIRRPFWAALVVAGLVDVAYLLLHGAERAVCRFANTTDEDHR